MVTKGVNEELSGWAMDRYIKGFLDEQEARPWIESISPLSRTENEKEQLWSTNKVKKFGHFASNRSRNESTPVSCECHRNAPMWQ